MQETQPPKHQRSVTSTRSHGDPDGDPDGDPLGSSGAIWGQWLGEAGQAAELDVIHLGWGGFYFLCFSLQTIFASPRQTSRGGGRHGSLKAWTAHLGASWLSKKATEI